MAWWVNQSDGSPFMAEPWVLPNDCGTMWDRGVQAMIDAEVPLEVWSPAGSFGGRSDVYFACSDVGMGWTTATLRFKIDSLLEVLKWRGLGGLSHRLLERIDVDLVRGGVVLCVPRDHCYQEYDRGSNRPVGWEQDVDFIDRLGLLLDRDQYLCRAIFPRFLVRTFPGLAKYILRVPAPARPFCDVRFDDIAVLWEEDGKVLVSEAPAEETSNVAVCMHGSVRSFVEPTVYNSIRKHVVDSLHATTLRIFLLLNLSSVSCTYCPDRRVQTNILQDLQPALAALGSEFIASLAIEPPCCWPDLEPGLSYEDCFFDQLSCPVQWRGKRACAGKIRQHEEGYDVAFDWVLDIRPDLHWAFDLGDVRRFRRGCLYSSYASWSELSDRVNLVPREMFDDFVGAFDSSGHAGLFTCWTDAEIKEHCPNYGSCGCRLWHHLRLAVAPLSGCTLQLGNASPSCKLKRLPRTIYSKYEAKVD